MSVYFEGDGNPRPVEYGDVRDLFLETIKQRREEILADPQLEAFEDPAERDRAVATSTIDSILAILDGDNPNCPGFQLIPDVGDDEKRLAVEAAGNWIPFDDGSSHYVPLNIAGNLCEYFRTVNT